MAPAPPTGAHQQHQQKMPRGGGGGRRRQKGANPAQKAMLHNSLSPLPEAPNIECPVDLFLDGFNVNEDTCTDDGDGQSELSEGFHESNFKGSDQIVIMVPSLLERLPSDHLSSEGGSDIESESDDELPEMCGARPPPPPP
jgi:hypothetical protein